MALKSKSRVVRKYSEILWDARTVLPKPITAQPVNPVLDDCQHLGRARTDLGRIASEPTGEADPPTLLDSQRWGPSLGHDEPSIAIPTDGWREHVANWPHDRWVAWRDRSAELQPSFPTAEQIRESERIAYDELRTHTERTDDR
jgi:hypothetical protein